MAANHSTIILSQNPEEAEERQQEKEDYGVLLYYKYFNTPIPDLQHLLDFYNSNCNSLSLLGRVRLSPTGVNVTVGGKMSALEKHIEAVKSNSLFEGTDFKLASCHQPLNDKVARECGFTSLSVRIVKELVTLSSNPLLKSPEISNAGRHLSAVEFHSVLQDAGKIQDKSNSSSDRRLILLDARNLYETRIGKFQNVNVKTLDPQIRQYSDLPSWIDDNSEQLRGNSILMYCTGGIRCEMASAYIKSKGVGFENVFQLYGGIQRYLEQFPDGGFFKGKNFVFDHRVSVGSLDSDVLGTCLLCGSSYDDYSSRCRCRYCRMLVLVCDGCQKKSPSYICELCKRSGKCVDSVSEMEDDNSEASEPAEIKLVSNSNQRKIPSSPALVNGSRTSKRLRILCLHGFRQNASGFKGRSGSLAKKLKALAELVFVNAPHELPFIYQPCLADHHNGISPSQDPCPPKVCSKKFAWLVGSDYQGKSDAGWTMADVPFDLLQYQQQTEGFDASLAYLRTVFSQAGPFDGILGFSQGAAMAALLCGQLGKLKGDVDFRFVILCSGFAINMEGFQQGSINLPSLHIFGNGKGRDRQINSQTSRHLASLFEDGCSEIIEHDLGHIIPTQSPHIERIKNFLQRFL
ncbi:rhodanese-like domain-containing protein 6 [Coffea eugenioides]|uniref:rhodanese-like domain-containing protein 6 n=1 Tax=Coffea eugenioides TaxID=49369 RepID=UPI000F614F7D|nr:rhodanese-like domain-containing protein 6 [Coffea eugenioides]